jgi:DNA replication and repair protein RecF
MRFAQISLGGLRSFAEAEFFPAAGLNWFAGANGAGKTSVLEALYLFGHGRSFRSSTLDPVVRVGDQSLWLSASLDIAERGELRAGLLRQRRGEWVVRIDGARLARLSELVSLAPILCFEPGSQQLVTGVSERRRRLLDWGVFHVEQIPLEAWRVYQRVLSQRNQALRMRNLDVVDAWEPQLLAASAEITQARRRFSALWFAAVHEVLAWLSPCLKGVELCLRPGWGQTHEGFADALSASRTRDVDQGFTSVGPHRADISLRFEGTDARDRCSRGQTKLIALALILALARCYQGRRGFAPVLLFDDVFSELDAEHADAVMRWLKVHEGQVFVTAVHPPPQPERALWRLFHVEQGLITPLL